MAIGALITGTTATRTTTTLAAPSVSTPAPAAPTQERFESGPAADPALSFKPFRGGQALFGAETGVGQGPGGGSGEGGGSSTAARPHYPNPLEKAWGVLAKGHSPSQTSALKRFSENLDAFKHPHSAGAEWMRGKLTEMAVDSVLTTGAKSANGVIGLMESAATMTMDGHNEDVALRVLGDYSTWRDKNPGADNARIAAWSAEQPVRGDYNNLEKSLMNGSLDSPDGATLRANSGPILTVLLEQTYQDLKTMYPSGW